MRKSLTVLLRSTSVLIVILLCGLLYAVFAWIVAGIAYSLFGLVGLIVSGIGLFIWMLALTERYLY